MKENQDWFKLKKYSHIELPLQIGDKNWLSKYIQQPKCVEKHAFLPFIHRKLKVRKFRKAKFDDGSRSEMRIRDFKEREVYFASHQDSNVYSYYAFKISDSYEKKLKELDLEDCITAYRRIPIEANRANSRNKCNVDFANDIFSYIKERLGQDLISISFDIKGFFDNLNHKLLKRTWIDLIGYENNLPNDHYNVFRNITKFSYVEEDDVFDLFKDKIMVERKPNIIKEKSVVKKRYLRNKRAVAFCTKENIHLIRKRNLIKSNKYIYENGINIGKRQKGIPQGSPISSLLANVYMLPFDLAVKNFMKEVNGIYRRYSDDMIIVCEPHHEDLVVNKIRELIAERKVELQESKTQLFNFKFNHTLLRHECFEKNFKTGTLLNNTNLEYLGLCFDGYFTLLKSSSLSGYYRKMKRAFRGRRFHTFHNKTSTRGKLFKGKLYKRFTHLGANRRLIYMRNPSNKSQFIKSFKYDWGNFITYAKLAQNIIPHNKIAGQISRHWNIFHGLIKQIEHKL